MMTILLLERLAGRVWSGSFARGASTRREYRAEVDDVGLDLGGNVELANNAVN
jgi:hypothetical protein